MAVDIAQLLAFAVKNNASDLHLSAGVPPMIRVDGDMKRIAQGHGVGSGKYLRLGLIKLSCFEPDAAMRVRAAMSLIEHEWNVTAGSTGRRIFVEISDRVIRSHR